MSLIKDLVQNQTDKGLQEYLIAYHNYDFTNEGMLAMREEMIKELSAEIIKRRCKKLETLLDEHK